MKAFVLLLALAFLASAVFAVPAEVIQPVSKTVLDNDVVDMGIVGPGQTVAVEVNALVKQGGKFGTGGRWDRLEIVNLPQGWASEDSLLYEQPLKAKIKVAPDAQEGEYVAVARVVDLENKEELGTVTFNMRIRITREVFSIGVFPVSVSAGAGQPAAYEVTVVNNGAASDAFEITSSGVPAWNYRKTIFVPHNSIRSARYEVASSEEDDLNVKIKVRSLSSDLLSEEKTVRLVVDTNLLSDYRAANHGLLVFPPVEQALYSLMGLISNLFA